jgi:biopolymer transport protein ExbD
MASIDTGGDSGHKKGPGVKKAKKLSTRVDMTPMVDLGFLLITFFIFTTTMSTPATMNLIMPKDKTEKQAEVKQSGTLTILLGKDNKIYYYEGILTVTAAQNNFKSASFGNIRDIIINKRKQVVSQHVHDESCKKIWSDNNGDQNSCLDKDLTVVIKPTKDANYKNTVDIIDEMTINGVGRYAIVDPIKEEVELVGLSDNQAPASQPAAK